MRILLDECLPRRLGAKLVGHVLFTVPQAGWAGVSNGALLDRIEGAFDAFITIDRNLPARQQVGGRGFGVVAIRAVSNRFEDLAPLVPEILAVLASLKPGDVAHVPTS
ncbi:MAG: hypothetical protein AB7T59_17980 [Hyphomonadaceae bacterium]